MSEALGGQTLEFISFTDGPKDKWGIVKRVPHTTSVSGCLFRPLSVQETIGLTDQNVEMWQGHVPPHPAVLAATSESQVKYGGVTYEIDGGIKVFPDATGGVSHVVVVCKRQQKQIA